MRKRPAWPAGLAVLVVAGLTAVGAALRLAVAGQSVFADELSTYWIVSTNGFGGVVSTVHTDAEITPPLFFVAAWLTTRLDLSPELLRAPSLLAGTAAIPLTYLLGVRSVGRPAGSVAAALTAVSPFMIFYSAEARGYALVAVLVVLSTLAMLGAVDADRRAPWWVAYATCSCAAMYTHYLAAFALGTQLLWLLWAHPDARRAALLANAAAVVAFLPWLSGLAADFDSPTTDILSSLDPLTFDRLRFSLEHWAVGYPGPVPLRDFPGIPALVMFTLGIAAGVAGLVAHMLRRTPVSRLAQLDRRLVLIMALAVSTPAGTVVFSAVGTDIIAVRHFAASWAPFALSVATLLVVAGPKLRFAAAALAVGALAIGAAKMMEAPFKRPDYAAAARFIDRTAAPGDVVVDGTEALSPGPLSGLDATLERSHSVIRVRAPRKRNLPFVRGERLLTLSEVTRRAASEAAGQRIFIAGLLPNEAYLAVIAEHVNRALPAGYRRVAARSYVGIIGVVVLVYAGRRALKQYGPQGMRPEAYGFEQTGFNAPLRVYRRPLAPPGA
jgi:hypothetical protein